ncbi:MAG: multidrug effflux MFS transporter, partial [Alphaproteobacteria bacterium]|nr:multidrug effflux MFS transporter [Alphaproteobacteria bacterium]
MHGRKARAQTTQGYRLSEESRDGREAARPILSERQASLIGALLAVLGPLSMSLYTPALPAIVDSLGTTPSAVKMTLALYFGGFACGQLLVGPLADSYGRKPVAMAFLGLYILASLACLAAPGVEMLIALRLVQGIGASSGLAVSRAIVRDLYTGRQSSRVLNLIGTIVAMGPAVAPTVGSLILAAFGWRATFLFMALVGLAALSVAALVMRETLGPDRRAFRPLAILNGYGEVISSPRFLLPAMVTSSMIGMIYAQSTFLPFILMGEAGLTPTQFGFAMILQTGSFVLSSMVFRRLMGRLPGATLLGAGILMMLAGSIGTATLPLAEISLLRVMLPVSVFVAGVAFMMPYAQTAVLAPFPRLAGSASALMGFLQMGNGLLISTAGA